MVQFNAADFVKKCIDKVAKTNNLLDGNKIVATQSKFPAVVETDAALNMEPTPVINAATKPGSKALSSSMKPRRLAMKPTSVVKSKPTAANVSTTASTNSVDQGSTSCNEKGHEAGSVGNGSTTCKSNSDFRKFFN